MVYLLRQLLQWHTHSLVPPFEATQNCIYKSVWSETHDFLTWSHWLALYQSIHQKGSHLSTLQTQQRCVSHRHLPVLFSVSGMKFLHVSLLLAPSMLYKVIVQLTVKYFHQWHFLFLLFPTVLMKSTTNVLFYILFYNISLLEYKLYDPWRRAWQLTPVFLPGESHG